MARVLIVDDDYVDLMVLRTRLIISGYEVMSETNPLNAIDTLSRESFEVIILDLNLPKMPGTKVAKIIKEDLKLNTPIIFTSSMISLLDSTELGKLGEAVTLEKPFTITNIKKAMELACNSGNC